MKKDVTGFVAGTAAMRLILKLETFGVNSPGDGGRIWSRICQGPMIFRAGRLTSRAREKHTDTTIDLYTVDGRKDRHRRMVGWPGEARRGEAAVNERDRTRRGEIRSCLERLR
ncbi:hypothetical protein KQX54_013652 [Cotesia glomerata]|uniref:Uncharacterized protein n=1 Tax=Cotesia glomerata TaxID=32391 RepID=A0AAV7IUK5_COTGL|nr:hypothetical protein KQX54_013652 [Cotesia glomerata]